MDEPGKLVGKVLRPDGRPYGKRLYLTTYVQPYHQPIITGGMGGWNTYDDGSYDFDFGPYKWAFRLNFGAVGRGEFPNQWAGGAVNAADAQLVEIKSGEPTDWSPRLAAGIEIKGTAASDEDNAVDRRLRLCDPTTGEVVDDLPAPYNYSARVLPGHTYKAFMTSTKEGTGARLEGWHDNANSLANATPFQVPAGPGPVTINLRLRQANPA
ncbi:hypothetical protein GCM10010123_06330 [Pilimelia anulata]|uniref:Uncharacterized protein n=1 Tax=Pilimelia anulata TaxID=53371 RepID=A0A8J3B7L4_9ACTN|nr:hypothetical protein [Pilimelia anulata]GGJ79130.1 hypothetical protein GCM10010123_06330 [Pilimelia anulata]